MSAKTNDRPTLALVGCGIWGRNVLRDLRTLGCPVVVCDPDRRTRERARDEGARDAVAGPDELPAADGIVVASPASTHFEVVSALLPRGVPVFCEKPLTTDVDQANRLAEAGGDRLFVMHNWRYHPGIEELGRIAREEELGPVLGLRTTRTNWTSPRKDVDSTWTLVPHDLSIAIGILGGIPEPRAAVAETLQRGTRTLIALLGRDPWMAIEASTRFREKRREVRLHCRDGVAVLPDGESGHLEILRPGPDGDREPEVELRPISKEPPLLRELRVFVEHLEGGPPPPTTAREGAGVVVALIRLRELAGLEGSGVA